MMTNADKLSLWTAGLRTILADEVAIVGDIGLHNKWDPDATALDVTMHLSKIYSKKDLADLLAVSLVVHASSILEEAERQGL